LKAIGFKWEIQTETSTNAFEKGFQETRRYKKQFGDPALPPNYVPRLKLDVS